MAEQSSSEPRKPRVAGTTRTVVITLDRGILLLARHWLVIANLFILTYVGLPALAPVLMYAGFEVPGKLLYTLYGPMCHQLGYRSWFLFGERWTYPRDVFESYTGIPVNTTDPSTYQSALWEARGFVGNAQMGYKTALCERDMAIYAVILLAGLVYGLPAVRRRVKPAHWALWLLIGVVPIGLDGFSQLFSQYPFTAMGLAGLLPYRESSAFLRTLTGGLFGLMNAWLAYPYIEESMRDVRMEVEAKLARVDGERRE